VSAARPRAADTAPSLDGAGLGDAVASVLEWRDLGKQAGAQETIAAGPVIAAARLAYCGRAGEVGTWQCGPGLIVWRESYSALEAGHGVTDLLTERSPRVGASPDWRGAEIAAGAAWPAVAAALGLTWQVRPARGSLRALIRAGEVGQARTVLECLAAPQIRRAT
jgi:hypothetical protein